MTDRDPLAAILESIGHDEMWDQSVDPRDPRYHVMDFNYGRQADALIAAGVGFPDARLRKAAQAVVTHWDEYVEAHAGRIHEGPHAIVSMISEDECGQCVSDCYGTEVTMSEYAIPDLRAALGEEPTRG